MEKSSWAQCYSHPQLHDTNGGLVGKTWAIFVYTCWCSSWGLYTASPEATGFPSSSTLRRGNIPSTLVISKLTRVGEIMDLSF